MKTTRLSITLCVNGTDHTLALEPRHTLGRSAARRGRDGRRVTLGALTTLTEIEDARLVLSGVAPIPWRISAAERVLIGAEAGAELFARAADLALVGSEPLEHNAYKLPLARAPIQRALGSLTEGISGGA
jgi:CO/xanthine dehydrogenase FAD-binding subunit